MLRQFHFGSARTAETEFLIQVGFLMLLSLLHIALNEPLAKLYYGRSEPDVASRWGARVRDLKPKLVELFSAVAERPVASPSEAGRLWERTKKKLRLNEFERILTEYDDLLPDD